MQSVKDKSVYYFHHWNTIRWTTIQRSCCTKKCQHSASPRTYAQKQME